jgi:class 3 adenylate cyclase
LGELREFGHCDICDIDFGATTQESIEVTFKVLPEIREVREVFYCSAEPAKKPHIFLQHHLAPKSSYTVDLELTEGRYRLRSATGDGPTRSLEVVQAGGDVEVSGDLQEERSELPRVIEQHVRLVVTNSEAELRSIVLEKLAEDPTALRPSDLFNLQQFRDLFSEESIASGLKLEVGAQTLLFTDIVGSTALYSLLGDTKAFNAVHAHFVALQEIITSRKGAVVKTIGDAMMAAFPHSEEALQAAVEIQQLFRPGEKDIAVRVSIHRGQCLAVRLDANIDYFGNAVNYAAKMQSVAGAGEIVFSKEFYSLPNIASQVQEHELELEERPLRSRFGPDKNSVYLAKIHP